MVFQRSLVSADADASHCLVSPLGLPGTLAVRMVIQRLVWLVMHRGDLRDVLGLKIDAEGLARI